MERVASELELLLTTTCKAPLCNYVDNSHIIQLFVLSVVLLFIHAVLNMC